MMMDTMMSTIVNTMMSDGYYGDYDGYDNGYYDEYDNDYGDESSLYKQAVVNLKRAKDQFHVAQRLKAWKGRD